MNGCLLGLLRDAQNGVLLSVPAGLVNQFGGIILLVILLVCNVVGLWGLNDAGSCVAGYLLSGARGYTFAVTGYLQSPAFAKMAFAQKLSLTSKYRKNLSRASFIWIIMELLKILTPISAISLTAQQYASYNDVSDCVYFVQDNSLKPADRKWPTLDTEGGVGEYVFGSSLGIMRSEVSGVNVTTAMYPPTLISALNNGDTIHGPGFSADISTTCKCASAATSEGISKAGVDPTQAQQVLQLYFGMNKQPGLTFSTILRDNETLVMANVLSGFGLCGGDRVTKSLPLVCSTVINNHQSMMLEMTFMTDGTTASIAPNYVTPIFPLGQADVHTWLYFAMTAITNGTVSSYLTPATVPGSLAPLLWWTSPNLIAMDRALLESGIETMYAILFKGAIQRSYTAKGMSCPRKNLLASTQSTVTILPSGLAASTFLLAAQMAVSIVSMFAFGLWLWSPSPLGPAVRAMQEPIYLITLLASSNHVGVGLNELCNAETYSIWQRLDIKCRIGESVSMLENEVGKIVVDKSNLVRPLQNGRRYS
ncbi:hypothetical protein HDU98_007146 [Podochytrium sp. JEL0797]|nr:hypothetical protein HDU98_007146 [Podochytrium sp. JEL0797]